MPQRTDMTLPERKHRRAFGACAIAALTILPTMPIRVALGEQPTQMLVLSISGIKPPAGNIICSVFASEKAFLRSPLLTRTTPVHSEGTAQCEFLLTPGMSYAATAIHDLDENGKLNHGLFGIPTEGVGTSNNPGSQFGPPAFSAAKFTVKATDNQDQGVNELPITMQYLF